MSVISSFFTLIAIYLRLELIALLGSCFLSINICSRMFVDTPNQRKEPVRINVVCIVLSFSILVSTRCDMI